MHRRLILLAAIGTCLIAATAAWAGNPHFLRISAPTIVYVGGTDGDRATALAASATTESSVDDPRVLVSEIVVVGVREGAVVQLDVEFEAVYVCVNGGGNVPNAANKTVLAGNLSATATFPAGRNGRAIGSLQTDSLPSAEDAAAESGFACPSGQVLEFDHVVFSGIVVSVDGGETATLEGVLVSESVHGLS